MPDDLPDATFLVYRGLKPGPELLWLVYNNLY